MQADCGCHAWTELDPADLVPRERDYLVHAESDEAFRPDMGDAFSPAGAVISDRTPLFFIVRDAAVLVLERQPDSWSEIIYQRGRAGVR